MQIATDPQTRQRAGKLKRKYRWSVRYFLPLPKKNGDKRMQPHGLFLLTLLMLAVSLVSHWLVRRFFIASAIAIAVGALANLADELIRSGFHVRPADAAFWGPMLLIMGGLFSAPIALITGLPFYLLRRWNTKSKSGR